MEKNPAIIVALITAIAAIIAPIITSYNNNKTQLQLKNMDLFYKDKSDIYQRFCLAFETLDSWVHDLNENIDNEPLSNEYLNIHKLTYLISNDEVRTLLDELSSHFDKPAINEGKYEILKKEIIKSMNYDLQSFNN
ncbi:hypothetical protein [Clostridium beijerinckii]|uniref:Uncharacterized protein n=1 Tax=Clostridium beijerinckii TaxID=1520 RepID=A0AAE5H833_CLOBE|nr:hypothetical protein [Clostridium beijerinckii]NSB15855.1 hypothetical protein [Clostridium beijerinckii]OOM27978.1 hypothetical protein CLOBE_28960 [Clostridium beijerinckii]